MDRALDLVEKCMCITDVLGRSQYEELGIPLKPNGLYDLIFTYKKGKLKIEQTILCDGPHSLFVEWDGKNVLSYADLDSEREAPTIKAYLPGFWEQKVDRLYRVLPFERITVKLNIGIKNCDCFPEQLYFPFVEEDHKYIY